MLQGEDRFCLLEACFIQESIFIAQINRQNIFAYPMGGFENDKPSFCVSDGWFWKW